MKVYRVEYLTRGYDYRKRDYVDRWEGIFSSSYMTYPDDANYQTYGCTLWRHKSEEWRFACRTMEKLIEYFGSDFGILLTKKNVRVVEYEVKRHHIVFSKQGIELVFKADKVERTTILWKTQLETLQSTGRTGRVTRTSVTESYQNGLVLSSRWQMQPMELVDLQRNLKKMEYFNELFTQDYDRGLPRSISIRSNIDS